MKKLKTYLKWVFQAPPKGRYFMGYPRISECKSWKEYRQLKREKKILETTPIHLLDKNLLKKYT